MTKSVNLEGHYRDNTGFTDTCVSARGRIATCTQHEMKGVGVLRDGARCSERLLPCSVVITHAHRAHATPEARSRARQDKKHARMCSRRQNVVTGGLGGLGTLSTTWLVHRGSRAARLTGRSGRAATSPTVALATKPVAVLMVRADAGSSEGARCGHGGDDVRHQAYPLVTGLMHSGGALHDAPIPRQCMRRLRGVWGGKSVGAWRLSQSALACSTALEWSALFSSVASLLGSPAQCNYSAANASLDASAGTMRRRGTPAAAVQWGEWTASGMAATSGKTLRRTVAEGFGAVSPESGLAALATVLRLACARAHIVAAARGIVGVIPIGWDILSKKISLVTRSTVVE